MVTFGAISNLGTPLCRQSDTNVKGMCCDEIYGNGVWKHPRRPFALEPGVWLRSSQCVNTADLRSRIRSCSATSWKVGKWTVKFDSIESIDPRQRSDWIVPRRSDSGRSVWRCITGSLRVELQKWPRPAKSRTDDYISTAKSASGTRFGEPLLVIVLVITGNLATAGMTGNLATAGYWEFDHEMALRIWQWLAMPAVAKFPKPFPWPNSHLWLRQRNSQNHCHSCAQIPKKHRVLGPEQNGSKSIEQRAALNFPAADFIHIRFEHRPGGAFDE